MMLKMRWLALLLLSATVMAQEPPPPLEQQPPPPTYNPPPPTYNPPPPAYNPPPTTSNIQPYYAPPATTVPTFRAYRTPQMQARWNRARNLYGVGGVTGLIGSALTLSGVLVVSITGYPCNPNDPIHGVNPNDPCNQKGAKYEPSKPTDTAPLLTYMGSSFSALGFVFSAASLGYQHHLLSEMGGDIDRKLFHAGTALGVFGFSAVALGYFFGFTDYLNPHDQGIAILAATLTGATLCGLGSLLYMIDGSRTKKAWLRFPTF